MYRCRGLLYRVYGPEVVDQGMDSHSRTRGSGAGLRVGLGIGMPGGRSHTRSCPSQLHLQTTAIHGFEFDDTVTAAVSTPSLTSRGGVAIPPIIRANVQETVGADGVC